MIRTAELLLLGIALGVMLGVPVVYWLSFERRLARRVTGQSIDLTGLRLSANGRDAGNNVATRIVDLEERRVGA